MLPSRPLSPWIAFAALFLSAIFAQSAITQEAENSVAIIHAESRSVVVDVVVTGKDGKAITGLTRQDFQVFEDGKPQSVTFFEQHAGAAPGAAPIDSIRPLPPDTFTNIPAGLPNDAVNVLLLDGLNTTSADQMVAHQQMAKYLATIPAGIRIAVFTLTLNDRLRIIQGFTEDSLALHAAIAHEIANSGVKAMAQNNGTAASPSILGQGMNTGHAASHAAQLEADYRTVTTLQGLQQIARYLAGIPGRKNLMWFTSYNPILLSAAAEGNDASKSSSNPNGDNPYFEMSKRTVNMLANAQVSVYPIEASGTATDSLTDASTVPTTYQGRGPAIYERETLRFDAKDRNIRHLNMDQLAQDTGGKATYNQNGLTEAIAADIDNGARYYTIAYTPTNRSAKGKERKIEVKLVSAKYNLAYRRSYFEDSPKEMKAEETGKPDRAQDPLRSLMDRGMPNFTELRYRTRIARGDPQPAANAARAGDNSDIKPPLTRYGVDFALALDGLSLTAGPDNIRHGKVEVALIAYNHDGKPLNWTVHFVGLVIRPDQYAMAEKSGIPFHLDIDVPPGEVYLRSGIYDTASSKAGTLEVPLSAIAVAQK